MHMHPEQALRLAEAKMEEARSRAQRAPALHAASLERHPPAGTAGPRHDRSAAPILAMVGRWRARRRTPHADTPQTING